MECSREPEVKVGKNGLEWVKHCTQDNSYENVQMINGDKYIDVKFPEEPYLICTLFMQKLGNGAVGAPLVTCHPFRKDQKKIIRLRIDPARPGAWPERE